MINVRLMWRMLTSTSILSTLCWRHIDTDIIELTSYRHQRTICVKITLYRHWRHTSIELTLFQRRCSINIELTSYRRRHNINTRSTPHLYTPTLNNIKFLQIVKYLYTINQNRSYLPPKKYFRKSQDTQQNNQN